jgi:hypothetical protein
MVAATWLLLLGAVSGHAAEESQQSSEPDRIVLRNGSVLFGTVTDVADGKISIETDFAGVVSIDQAQVVDMRVYSDHALQLANGRVLDAVQIEVREGDLILPDEAVELGDLERIDPEPWELGDGYEWTGTASFGLVIEQGNTDTEEADYRVNTRLNGLDDRYTLRALGEIDRVNGIKNAENWSVTGKYDRFLSDDNYWGVATRFERDQFADLNLRAYLGPYLGRGFTWREDTRIELELGLSYVREHFILRDDGDYAGMVWTINATGEWFGDRFEPYFYQNGVWNLQQTSNVVVDTTAGVAFPLIGNIVGSAELLVEYDAGTAFDVASVDQTYQFRLGYTW